MEKIAIIFGAASGIGKSAYELLKKQYKDLKFILLDKETVMLLDPQDIYYKLDFSNMNEINLFIKKNLTKYKHIKFLINTVGYQEDLNVLNLDQTSWDSMYNTTVKSVFFLEQAVVNIMLKNKISNQSIVNVTSIHSEIIRDIPHYSSSKSALKMLSKELAYKLAVDGIRVNCIEPGSIDTPLLRRSLTNQQEIESAAKNVPMLRHGTPEEVSKLIAFLVSEDASYITGASIVIDGGLSLVI